MTEATRGSKVRAAAILAAGVGSRLGDISSAHPKCLTKVAGRTILERQLDALEAVGIERIFIVIGYRAADVRALLRSHPSPKVTLVENADYEFTNNMVSALMLRPHLDGSPFLLINGDVALDADLIAAVAFGSGDCIAVDVGTFDIESMKVTVNPNHIIERISKDVPEELAFGRSTDVYRFGSESGSNLFAACDAIVTEAGRKNEWTEVAIQDCIDAGTYRPIAVPIGTARWAEIDTLDDLMVAHRAFGPSDLSDFTRWYLDLDGTLAIGEDAVPGAVGFLEGLRSLGRDFTIVSNNSALSRVQIAARLRGYGLAVDTTDVMLSTQSTIAYLHEEGVDSVFCLGTRALVEELSGAGVATANTPQYVVVGYDTELTYDKVAKACSLIASGVPYVVTHPDRSYPSKTGPIPDAGAIAVMIETTTGVSPIRVCGKPDPSMLPHKGTTDDHSVMVGDRLYTDKVLADRAGIPFICVLSGETTLEDLDRLGEDEWPYAVAASVGELL